MKRILTSAFLAGAVALGANTLPAIGDSATPIHLRGEIETVSAQSFAIKSAGSGDVSVAWNNATKVSSLSAAQLSDIKPGLFVGTAAVVQPDGTLKAAEVHIFPESLRGTGEGFRPFPQLPKGTMTNATVSNMLGTANAQGGQTLTLTYKNGQQTVFVPKDVPIVLLGKGDASLIQPHAKVSVTATKDAAGQLTATRVLVGLNGLTPPI